MPQVDRRNAASKFWRSRFSCDVADLRFGMDIRFQSSFRIMKFPNYIFLLTRKQLDLVSIVYDHRLKSHVRMLE